MEFFKIELFAQTTLHCHVFIAILLFQPIRRTKIAQPYLPVVIHRNNEMSRCMGNWLKYLCFVWLNYAYAKEHLMQMSLSLFFVWCAYFNFSTDFSYVQWNHQLKCNKIHLINSSSLRPDATNILIFIIFIFIFSRRRHIPSLKMILCFFYSHFYGAVLFYYCRIKNGLLAGKMTYVNKIVYQNRETLEQ